MNRAQTLGEARKQYLDENGFTTDEYTAERVTVSLGPLHVRVPNGPARQRAIPMHDLHHVLTGYGTDLVGEAEVSAWELRAGCNSAFLWCINLTGALLGLFLSPRRVWRAFRAARGARSLYLGGLEATDYLERPVVEVRRWAGVPDEGVGDPRLRRLHPRAPRPAATHPFAST
jgi:ubiquinone biosynthesis protein Coq4